MRHVHKRSRAQKTRLKSLMAKSTGKTFMLHRSKHLRDILVWVKVNESRVCFISNLLSLFCRGDVIKFNLPQMKRRRSKTAAADVENSVLINNPYQTNTDIGKRPSALHFMVVFWMNSHTFGVSNYAKFVSDAPVCEVLKREHVVFFQNTRTRTSIINEFDTPILKLRDNDH